MISWSPYTYVRKVLFFIVGILTYNHAKQFIEVYLVLSMLIISGLSYLFLFFSFRKQWAFFTNKNYYRSKHYFGLLAFFFIASSGFLLTYLKTEINDSSHLYNIRGKVDAYQATVIKPAELKGKYQKTILEIEYVQTDNGWIAATGNVLAYIESPGQELIYGDKLLIKGKPFDLKGPMNPGQFDYRRFMNYQQVYFQHFIKTSNLEIYSNDPPWLLLSASYKIRKVFNDKLQRFLGSGQEFGIVSALVLGVKDGLDNEIKNAYSAAGAMHVLAVSGLHVGIIYIVLNFLFGWLNKTRKGAIIFALLIIFLLWFYAYITGLSASVLRAVTMFTFITFAKVFKRESGIYNTLSVSGFCLLLYDPYLIMNVGFQLSFAAVIGIVYLYPLIYKSVIIKNKLADYIWGITCVSIAAQIATFPISLFYFNQFPTYSLLANLFVIPASFLVFYAGLALLLVSFVVPYLAKPLGIVLNWSVEFLNQAIFFVEKLPHSIVSGIVIDSYQVWLIYALIVFFLLLLYYRRFTYIYSISFIALLLIVSPLVKAADQYKQNGFTVYQIKASTAIAFIQGKEVVFLADSILLKDQPKIRFHVQNHWWHRGIEQVKLIELNNCASSVQSINIKKLSSFTLVVWQGKTILILNKPFDGNSDLPLSEVDYIIVRNNAVKKPTNFLKHVRGGLVIFDSSNSNFYVKKLEQELQANGIASYNVLEKGAFVEAL